MAVNTNITPNEKIIIPNSNKKVPFSVVESYKNLRTNIISILSKSGSNVLAITSPNASEGKSTTSVNVAITLSQLSKKVVLVDADSRRPSINKKLKLENQKGCMNILRGDIELDDAIIHYNKYLDIITSGTKVKNPTELFSDEKFDDLLDTLKATYDYVILDTPPINPVSDALIIAQKCESLVMIVRAGGTSFESFEKAYNALKVLEIKLNGVIINGFDSTRKYFYNSGYKYGYKYKSKGYSQYY